jgi:hypothetical protein
MTRRDALRSVKLALKTAAYIEDKDCGCNFCKAARRLRKQLAPVEAYLNSSTHNSNKGRQS